MTTRADEDRRRFVPAFRYEDLVGGITLTDRGSRLDPSLLELRRQLC
ncbi:hypothetical protein HALLA_00385 (plasmid) [Halostagnicola larsenii XH-48]|uniref:Uncharacterized protein n=1 Tax=Halostagnicola larsenii XH-48 TaxID=797299 RepID=W0JX50_9EURY|nr:hypothetical protein HALLA_00385 [Halostagnicola larsenii XH-48]